MDINELDNLSRRIFKRCLPEKEEDNTEKKFLELFSGIEPGTIGHIVYETIKIAIIAVTGGKIRDLITEDNDKKIKEARDRIENHSIEILKLEGVDEKNAQIIAKTIAYAFEAEVRKLS